MKSLGPRIIAIAINDARPDARTMPRERRISREFFRGESGEEREKPGDLPIYSSIKDAMKEKLRYRACKFPIIERVNRIYAKSAPCGSRFSLVRLRYRCVTVATAKRAIRWSGVPCQYWYCRVCYRVARRRARASESARDRG